MATILQLRRGTSTQHSTFTGAVGEVTVDTTKKTIVVHDGSTAGGSPLATEDFVTTTLQTADSLGELSGTSDDITEGSTNLFFTDSRARAAISVTGSGTYDDATGVIDITGDVSSVNSLTGAVVLDTDDISEGSSNLYFTNARGRGAVSVTDNGGDGSLSYNSTTGVISYTGPSASEVRAHFSAGTGITITNGQVAVDTSTIATKTYADSAATAAVAAVIDSAPAALDTLNELANALGDDANYSTTVSTALGNRLRVDVNTQNLTSTEQSYALTNLGITATNTELNYVDGVTSNIQTQLDAKFASADFNSSFDTRLGGKSTTNLAEGTNLYFTNTRARSALSAGSGITYNSSTGVISADTTVVATKTYVDDAVAGKDNTDEITEGSTNLYFTNARARSALSAGTGISYNSTTGAISSTITQYTDALARSAVSFTAGSGAYNSTTGVFTIPTNTSHLTNGANFIDLTDLSAGTGISYDNTTGVISADTTTVATKTYVDTAISDLVGGASAAYDTLKEIQDAMATDAELSAAIAAITIGNGTQTVTAGSYLTGGGSFTANQTSDSSVTLAVDATSANTASKVVARDASGNFSAGTITAALSGNATTATTLQTARTIGGVSFNGSANINLPGVNTTGNQNTTGNAAGLTGMTTTVTELNYVAGVTSAIQTQLDAKLAASSYTAADVLTKLKTVDGSGSGLDADLLDGQSSAYFRINIYDAAGTLLN